MQEEAPDATQCQKVVVIVQAAFRDSTLVVEIMCQMVVMIPKGNDGYFWGVGLVGALWKTMTVLLNRGFNLSIRFHYVLHGLRAGRRTETAVLKSNMIQQLTTMREAVLR